MTVVVLTFLIDLFADCLGPAEDNSLLALLPLNLKPKLAFFSEPIVVPLALVAEVG